MSLSALSQDEQKPLVFSRSEYMLSSFKRRKRHETRFAIPQTLATVVAPKSLVSQAKIYHAVLTLCAKEQAYPVISPIIKHWTTWGNLQSIIRTGAFLGQAELIKRSIPFTPNALMADDVQNLDGNIICFCPSGHVDMLAFFGRQPFTGYYLKPDLTCVSIDASKIEVNGHFNVFFKAVDLCMDSFVCRLSISNDIDMQVRQNREGHHSTYEVTFSVGTHKTQTVTLAPNELIFYGHLKAMNRFCLLLPFIALAKCHDSIQQNVYHALSQLDAESLSEKLVLMAKSMTRYAEFNINGALPLTSHLIHEVHHVTNQTTYSFAELSETDYQQALDEIVYLGEPSVFSQKQVLVSFDNQEVRYEGVKVGQFKGKDLLNITSYTQESNIICR